MKITFINSPLQDYGRVRRKGYYTTPPIGLGYLATVAKKSGCYVNLIDAEALGLSPKKIVSLLDEQKPDVVGINLITPTLGLSKQIIDQINAPKIIVGGAHAIIKPVETMREIPRADILATGEAEKTLEELVQKGFNPEGIKGILYRVNGEVIQNPSRELTEDLDSLPFIDRSFFVNDPYQENGHFKSVIMGSRGCPNSCTFCASPSISSKRIRARSVGNIVDEIEILKDKYGINAVHFLDNYFIYDKDRSLEFIKELERRKLGIEWRALARVDLVAREGLDFVKDLKQGGCYKLVFGVESGSQRILDMVKKGTTPEQAKQAVQYCKEAGIKTKAYYMFGFPTETLSEMEQTLRHARELGTDTACFLLTKAYPGTELYNSLAKQFGEEALQKYMSLDTEVPLEKLPSNINCEKYHIANQTNFSRATSEQLRSMLRKAYNLYYLNGDKKK